MNPGLLRHSITFQKATIVEDEIGNQTEEWKDYKTVKSMIKTIKGSEYFEAASTHSERTYRFIIRYRSDISSYMRINYKKRIFDIIETPINDDETNKTLTIIARERV